MTSKLSGEFLEKLQDHIRLGNISEQVHPTLPLRILNYTDQCTYARAWDDVTKTCRGLIVNQANEVVAKPFPKFFNVEEHDPSEIPAGEVPLVFTKEDGSLGIFYTFEEKAYIATRGSFVSDQALWATERFRAYPATFRLLLAAGVVVYGYTPLFEIIYPENRVVVDYGGDEKLILLGAVGKYTHNQPFLEPYLMPWPDKASSHPYTSLADLKALNTENREGFVLYYPKSDFRVKVKFPAYVELHRKVFGLSTTWVWEAMENGTKHELTLLDGLPDEYMDWVEDTGRGLRFHAQAIYDDCKHALIQADPSWTRKEFAEYANRQKYPKVLFLMYDNKAYHEAIWKLVKPKYAKANPYRRSPWVGEDNVGQATA